MNESLYLFVSLLRLLFQFCYQNFGDRAKTVKFEYEIQFQLLSEMYVFHES